MADAQYPCAASSWASAAPAQTVNPPLSSIKIKTPTNTTTAISKALTTLGFNETYHMKTCVRNPAHNEMWLAALEGKYGDGKPFRKEEWDELLGDFQ
ncbi:MAG: hypothetical protein Q9198_005848, partial [Flavoplaca austrocitrina]